jgi:hypothetical protein
MALTDFNGLARFPATGVTGGSPGHRDRLAGHCSLIAVLCHLCHPHVPLRDRRRHRHSAQSRGRIAGDAPQAVTAAEFRRALQRHRGLAGQAEREGRKAIHE